MGPRILKLNKQRLSAQCTISNPSLSLLLHKGTSYGPRQSKNLGYHEKGKLNVEVKFAPFSCQKRRAPLKASLIEPHLLLSV